MPLQLCSVCQIIPDDFWSKAFDLFESRHEAKARLQSYNSMQVQRKRGCHLCALFVDYIWVKKLRDYNDCLYLQRDYGDPHRAVCLVTEDFQDTFGKLYFFRVPDVWCESLATGLRDDIDNVRLMKTWLRTRDAVARPQHFRPTRLLDLGDFQTSHSVRLVLSPEIRVVPAPHYVALSHCWGGTVPTQLKKDNIDQWIKRGIELRNLPQTFRDAVQITRSLDYRYLWIDSMCIIQNSEKDWKHEASLMAEVYGNAICTLAALSSKNSGEGCKLNTNIQLSLRSPYVEIKADLHRSSRIRIFPILPRSWTEEFNGSPVQAGRESDSPLRSRAWVLQEKELSNCTIYFAKNQLLWENRKKKATAQLPWVEMESKTSAETPRLLRKNSSHQIVDGGQYPWYDLIEDYASRSLTVPTDKLVAFSGLARSFNSRGKCQYFAGIWNNDLPYALLWQSNSQVAKRPAYLAPSWSWASLMGSVTYDSLRLESDRDCAQYEHPEEIYPGLRPLKIQRVQMSLEDDDKPYGGVRDGRIVLSGARSIRVECGQDNVQFSDGGQPLNQTRRPIGVFYPDVTGELAHYMDVFCVALLSESNRSMCRHQFRLEQDSAMKSTVMGIVIAKVPGSQGYRRLGMARWVDEFLFDTVPITTIELF